MGSKQKKEGGAGLSRRDFLKVSAAGAAGVAAANWAVVEPAIAAPLVEGTDYETFHTTCPYCSAQCGQIVAVAKAGGAAGAAGTVIDVWGDKESPINQGGLCAKGAGSHQLATNRRRLGYPHDATLPLKWQQPKAVLRQQSLATYPSGVAWKRLGNEAWVPMDLQTAFGEIATTLVAKRGAITPGVTAASNAKTVQFFGCSHMNNEPNYVYRKVIANFGTSLVEHQARI